MMISSAFNIHFRNRLLSVPWTWSIEATVMIPFHLSYRGVTFWLVKKFSNIQPPGVTQSMKSSARMGHTLFCSKWATRDILTSVAVQIFFIIFINRKTTSWWFCVVIITLKAGRLTNSALVQTYPCHTTSESYFNMQWTSDGSSWTGITICTTLSSDRGPRPWHWGILIRPHCGRSLMRHVQVR